MTSRFLSFVAAIGLLAAAGCSGGGAGSALGGLSGGGSGVTPTTGAGGSGATATQSNGGASFTTSFNIPVAGNLNTQTQGRSPLYVSPGSTGLQVVLSANGTATSGAGSPGTGQLSGNFTVTNGNNYSATSSVSVSLIPGSVSTTPVVNQTFTIQYLPTNANYVAYQPGPPVVQGSQSLTFVIDTVTANNTVLTGHLQGGAVAYGGTTQTYPAGSIITFGGASSASFVIGTTTQPAAIVPGTSGTVSIPSTVYGAGSAASYTYKFSQPNNASGYVQGTITFNGMQASTPFVIGIVLSDLSNNNYILSEGQSTAFTTAAAGTTNVNLTLNPVVANVYIPAPTNLTAATAGAFNAGSFETTVFATDERGWVIPSITYVSGNATAPTGVFVTDNAAEIVITPAVANSLTFNTVNPYAQANVSSITAAPAAGGVVTGALNTVNIGQAVAGFVPTAGYTNPLGGFITNPSVPGSPFTLPLNTPLVGGVATPTLTNANGVGSPLNISCAVSTANVALKVQLISTAPAAMAAAPDQLPVAGVNINPGVNYPANGTTTIPAGSNISTVNCTPSFNVNVN